VDSLDTLVAPPRESPPSTREEPAPAIAPRPGSAFGVHSLVHGRYRLRERLGVGGFGVVWRAEDELLHRDVALKRIPLRSASASAQGGPEAHAGARAGREALAAARLGHPAIVALYEAYVDDDACYLVSELVRGETLAQLIAAGELSDEQTLQIGLALAGALAHAHARGVIHRDVKPQNVLIPRTRAEHDTPAKLTDFGGARLAGEQDLTRSGETLGTLAYMAPEQGEGRPVGEQADVYSLALVLYEALSGTNPVRGPNPAATARRIGRPIPPLETRRPDLPRDLARSLDAALAIDPLQRPSLAQLRAGLERARAREPAPATAALAPADARNADVGEHQQLAGGPRPSAPRLALPRAIWLGSALALAIWQAVSGRPGLALLALALAAPLLLLGRRPDAGWLAAGLAPALGLAGLAGIYPALAGQASRWQRRAALGALGYWWLTLCGPLLAPAHSRGRLWLALPGGMPPRAAWESSLDTAAAHVLAPALGLGLLLGAALWAFAAALLPWVVRGRNAVLDALAALVWSAALFFAAAPLDTGLAHDARLGQPRGALLAALLGGAVAIAARALRGPV
jgi:eukaryotic-like serine/threonine-protein kinase